MNTIKIDTSNNLSTEIVLETKKGSFVAEEKRGKPGDQNVLSLIEKLLIKQKVSLKDIDQVLVETGPGSFTGLRVGAAIANALSFGISVSVNGKPLGEIAEPKY